MNPFFDLKQVSIQTIGGETIPGKVALQHPNGRVFAVVSKRYKPILNTTVNAMFTNVMSDMGIKIENTIDHLDPTGKKWKRWLLLKDFDLTVAPKDTVGVMVEIFNGYDGLTAIGFRVLGYRHICKNGMITGKSLLMEHSVKHVTHEYEKLIQEFQEKFNLFNTNTEIWKTWTEIPFSFSQFKQVVENADYLGERLQKKLVEYYRIGITKYGMKETVWGAFNVITDYMTHYTKATNGSNMFSNAVRQLVKLATEFYGFEESPKVPLLTF
jgi:hypothetical protein